ncbi:hypothetical protein V5F72_00760 [Xanthobacter flavus]|uniref:hypothetical protein n=1 Tax=Xanthobacter flavus TaxID=281 RepID=UPI00372C9740
MAQLPSHAQQKEAAVLRSLQESGFRKRYHHMTFDAVEHPEAWRIKEWVSSRTALSQSPGRGFVFVGGTGMEDFAMVTARALHLQGQKTLALSLTTLHLAMSEEREERERIEDRMDAASVLLLTKCGPIRQGDDFLTPREARRIDNVLDNWISDGRRLLMHTSVPLRSVTWFAGDLVKRVALVTETLVETK